MDPSPEMAMPWKGQFGMNTECTQNHRYMSLEGQCLNKSQFNDYHSFTFSKIACISLEKQ